MSKKSKYPSYSAGTVTINGNTVATSKKKKNNVTSSYNMGNTEKSIYDGIQDNLETSLKNLYTISDEKQQQWNDELDAYKKAGIEEINSIYTPMVNNLRDNIASRFGNLDNSIFMDNLNTITDKQAKAVSDLSDNLLTKQDELYTKEMQNRMNYITLLSNLNTTMNNNMLTYMQMAQSNSASGNAHNQNAYKGSSSGSLDGLYRTVGNLGSNILSFLASS